MKSVFLSLLFLSTTSMAQSTSTMIRVESLDSWKTDCRLRVVVQAPKGTAKGDVLFLIGFGDRADNHSPLFNKIVNSGFRVFSFDYPAHGESDCGSINFSSFKELMTAASAVERSVRAGSTAPLFLVGWSTGGVLAARIVQSNLFSSRNLQGMALLAPAFSAYKLVGGDGIIRVETLTDHPSPPYKGEIYPTTPLASPNFAAALLYNGYQARKEGLPKDLPTFIVLGGDETDLYTKTREVKDWMATQGGHLKSLQCYSAKHDLSNAIEPIGSEVRGSIVSFLKNPRGPIERTTNCGTLK